MASSWQSGAPEGLHPADGHVGSISMWPRRPTSARCRRPGAESPVSRSPSRSGRDSPGGTGARRGAGTSEERGSTRGRQGRPRAPRMAGTATPTPNQPTASAAPRARSLPRGTGHTGPGIPAACCALGHGAASLSPHQCHEPPRGDNHRCPQARPSVLGAERPGETPALRRLLTAGTARDPASGNGQLSRSRLGGWAAMSEPAPSHAVTCLHVAGAPVIGGSIWKRHCPSRSRCSNHLSLRSSPRQPSKYVAPMALTANPGGGPWGPGRCRAAPKPCG